LAPKSSGVCGDPFPLPVAGGFWVLDVSDVPVGAAAIGGEREVELAGTVAAGLPDTLGEALAAPVVTAPAAKPPLVPDGTAAVGGEREVILAGTVAAGLPDTLGEAFGTPVVTASLAKPSPSIDPPQAASVAVRVSSPKPRDKSPQHPSKFTCSHLASR